MAREGELGKALIFHQNKLRKLYSAPGYGAWLRFPIFITLGGEEPHFNTSSTVDMQCACKCLAELFSNSIIIQNE